MTPKEKAEELVDKFLPLADIYHNGSFENAKQCALIAVDEMIKWSRKFLNEELLTHALLYLEEVKQEIEKL